MLLLARLVHIVVGVFWAGTVIFNAWLLAPALRDIGPDAGKVMGALARRGMLVILPVTGILTILSGLWLYWHASVGIVSVLPAPHFGHVSVDWRMTVIWEARSRK